MSMQTQKTDRQTHTQKFVSGIGGAGEDDIHTQTGMTATDIQGYLRQGKAKYYRLSRPTPRWKNARRLQIPYCIYSV